MRTLTASTVVALMYLVPQSAMADLLVPLEFEGTQAHDHYEIRSFVVQAVPGDEPVRIRVFGEALDTTLLSVIGNGKSNANIFFNDDTFFRDPSLSLENIENGMKINVFVAPYYPGTPGRVFVHVTGAELFDSPDNSAGSVLARALGLSASDEARFIPQDDGPLLVSHQVLGVARRESIAGRLLGQHGFPFGEIIKALEFGVQNASEGLGMYVTDGVPQVSSNDSEGVEFPWPPRKPSAIFEFPSQVVQLIGAGTMGQMADTLLAALTLAGYERQHHRFVDVPGGIAILTRIEQIYDDGRPLEDAQRRWSIDMPPVPGSVVAYLKALTSGQIGYYRVALVLYSDAFEDPKGVLDEEEAARLLDEGKLQLPDLLRNSPASEDHELWVLIYEFKRHESQNAVTFNDPADIKTERHLNGMQLVVDSLVRE